jgi:secreted Zn-dependent insulinase-like peptidase
MALTEVLADCLKDLLSEYSYYADCAELHYDVNLSKGGLHLTFNGFQVTFIPNISIW